MALARGIAQVWQDGPRLAPPVTPQLPQEWEDLNVAIAPSNFVALKICAPDKDFAVESKAQILGGTERSTEALGLWMSSLEMLNFRGLENANVAKK